MFVCNKCKSRDVLVKGWIDPNWRYEATDWDAIWCNDCAKNVELDEVEEE
jgi:hypothetical protein